MAKQKWNPRMKPRIVVIFYSMLLFVAYLAYSFVQVQAREYYVLNQRALAEHVGVLPLPALRGAILDCNHQILAASLTLPSIAANPEQVRRDPNWENVARFLSRLTHQSEHEIHHLLTSPGTFVWIARKVPEALAAHVERLKAPGVFILREPTGKRFYPKGRLAVHVLGYTGIDDNGLDGIEAVYDKVLRGRPGQLMAEMDRDGRVIPYGWRKLTPARPGRDVVLTIDETIQFVAERALEATMKKHKAKSGEAIVMDVHTGDILALVNKPDYATRNFWKVPAALRRDRAITDAYEPGSTFKIVLASAALDTHTITMGQQFVAGPTITVDGWTLHNADDGEAASNMEDITGIITHSLNVGTTSVALKMGKKKYFDYICRFGFGRQTGIDLPGEAEGIVQPLHDWAKITLATNSFGQGVAVTPIQLMGAMQTIANRGVMMKPRLVKEIVDPDGRIDRILKPVVRRRVISEETSLEMREILRNVVAHGTGRLADVPGYPVAGKTGTANVVVHGVYASGRYVASFLGFAPLQDPRVVILVKVDEPSPEDHWGGSVAGPAFKAIMRETLWHLGVKPVMVAQDKDKKDKDDAQ